MGTGQQTPRSDDQPRPDNIAILVEYSRETALVTGYHQFGSENCPG